MGFKSPGQSTHKHKPPPLTAASASSISRHGGTLGWLWNLRSGVDNGGQRTQLYLTYLAHRLSARPDPARRAGATTRLGTGALSPPSRPPPLGQRSLHGTPGAGCASLRVHELTRGQSYPTTRTGHLPADLAFSLMPQLHDAMEAGTGRPDVQECVDTHGGSSTTRTTRRGHHHSQNRPIDAQGSSIRAGDYHPSSAASG